MLFPLVFLNLFAYIGPGFGTGVIGVVLGILTAFFLSLTALIWYPIKRLIKYFKAKSTNHDNASSDANGQA